MNDLPLTQALKQMELEVLNNNPRPARGTDTEPVHVRFGSQSHYGEHPKYGPHFATMHRGHNVHIYPNELFVIPPDGKGIKRPMDKKMKFLYDELVKRTGRGLEKKAMNIKDARKAVNALKGKGYIKAGRIVDPKDAASSLGFSTLLRGPKPQRAKGEYSFGPSHSAYTGRIYNVGDNLPELIKDNKAGRVMANPTDINKELEKIRKNPRLREMFNRLTILHEGAEKAEFQRLGRTMEDFSHVSPGVILRESNMLATMPKEYKPIRDLFKKLRKEQSYRIYDVDGITPIKDTNEIAMLEDAVPGFKFGETRLPNKSTKKISDILERKYNMEILDDWD